MENRVLIIGPNYYNFLQAVASAFHELGWDAQVEGYDNPINPYTRLMKWRYKFSRNRERLQERSRASFRTYIEDRFEELHPDFVFIMNGDILESATLDKFRKESKVALWFFDSRTKLDSSIGHAEHVDALFCFEQDDVEWFQSQEKQAYFLPQACNINQYFPMRDAVKDIDILFVGNLFYSPRRRRLMNAVIDKYSDKRIEVYGWYQPWFKGIRAWLKRPHKDVFKNKNVSSEEANRLYNRARVVLNIHQEHQTNGANPRVFEICGAGAYQVCDMNPFVASLFPEGAIGLYSDEQELFARIEEALSQDKSAQAALAHEIVLKNHTFRARMEEVLMILGYPVK